MSEHDLKLLKLVRKIKSAQLPEKSSERVCLAKHCEWQNGTGSTRLFRCLRNLKYKGRNEDENL